MFKRVSPPDLLVSVETLGSHPRWIQTATFLNLSSLTVDLASNFVCRGAAIHLVSLQVAFLDETAIAGGASEGLLGTVHADMSLDAEQLVVGSVALTAGEELVRSVGVLVADELLCVPTVNVILGLRSQKGLIHLN